MTGSDEHESDRSRPAQPDGRDAPGSEGVRRYRAADLIGNASWVVIEHGNAEYRLRITRLGKLILTK
jgi:hemin uptake protein HemP